MSLLQSVLQRFRPRAEEEEEGPALHVAAFGKHPGSDEHLGFGLDTESLVDVRRTLYTEGIRENIDAGVWNDGDGSRGLVPFHHLFVHFAPGRWVMGRLWESTDRGGRSSYPMIVCAECTAPVFVEAAPLVFDRLEQLEIECTGTREQAAVKESLARAAAGLEVKVLSPGMHPDSDDPERTADPVTMLAARPEFGDDLTGLVRIFYQIDREMSQYRMPKPSSSTWHRATPATEHAYHMRVPMAADRPVDALVLWGTFLREQFDEHAPLWLIKPLEEAWVDVVVGPPESRELGCIRMPLEEIPLTTEIPYQIDESFADSVRTRIRQWQGTGSGSGM